jgi:hypothetical protein
MTDETKKEETKPVEESKFKRYCDLDPKLTEEQFKRWKATYGKIVATVLGDRIYVYRAITRLEHASLLAMETNPQAKPHESQAFREEKIVEKALLYPHLSPEELSTQRGGTLSSLVAGIFFFSDFLSVDAIIMASEEL